MKLFKGQTGEDTHIRQDDPLLRFIEEREPNLLEDENVPPEDYLAVVAEGFINLIEPPDSEEIQQLWRDCAKTVREQIKKGELEILAGTPIEKIEAAARVVFKEFDRETSKWDNEFFREHPIDEDSSEYKREMELYEQGKYEKTTLAQACYEKGQFNDAVKHITRHCGTVAEDYRDWHFLNKVMLHYKIAEVRHWLNRFSEILKKIRHSENFDDDQALSQAFHALQEAEKVV